jgi:CII-binding regulator of phage lambda lysogenization HflD
MDILQRLKEILDYSGHSVRAFAMKCSISQTTLDKQIKGLRSVSIETVMSVLYAYPEVSAEWLTRGEGTMLIKKDKDSAETERLNKLVDTIGTLQDTINAKNDMIATLNERIKQLENQLGK